MPRATRIVRGIALRKQGYRCFYCKAPLAPKAATADHMHPKHRKGKLRQENIAACCSGCNRAKGGMFSQQFFKIINKSKPPAGAEPEVLLIWASRRIWRKTHKACERIERLVQPQPITAHP